MIFERAARREFAQAAAGISVALLAILTSTNLPGTVGTPLSLQLTANPPNDLIFSEGRLGLPAGLSLSSGGLISGTPRSAGSGSVTAWSMMFPPRTVTLPWSFRITPFIPT